MAVTTRVGRDVGDSRHGLDPEHLCRARVETAADKADSYEIRVVTAAIAVEARGATSGSG
jgi:hypothetical protein